MVSTKHFEGARGVVIPLVLLILIFGNPLIDVCTPAAMVKDQLIFPSTVVLTACCWEAHVRVLKGEASLFLLRVASNLVYLLFWTLLPAFLLAIVTPHYSCYTTRARVSELILAASSAKTALAEGMQTYHEWSPDWMRSITISATGMVAGATIGPTGQIMVWGTAPTEGSIVVMTPIRTTDDKLVWSCTGAPLKYMPASCR
jgi:type IV pilus assembly protein PilA